MALENNRTRTVVGLGLINKDLIAVVPSLERDGKMAATYYFEQVGGPVPVALMALAHFRPEDECHCISVTGDDREGHDLAAALQRFRVTPHITVVPGIATSRSLVLLNARDGSRTLANYAETLPPLTLEIPHRDLLARTDLLHMDGRDLPVSLEAASLVRENGGIVSLDLGTMRPEREKLIVLCDIILASQKGAAGAFPDVAEDPIEQVRRFLGMGPIIAGVTLGAEGVVIGTADFAPVHLPAFSVEQVVDTCGAGDLFHGAFLTAHLNGASVVDAAQFAQAAVALRIQRYGNTAIPSSDAVYDFLAGCVSTS